jgi:hypothetical protein
LYPKAQKRFSLMILFVLRESRMVSATCIR